MKAIWALVVAAVLLADRRGRALPTTWTCRCAQRDDRRTLRPADERETFSWMRRSAPRSPEREADGNRRTGAGDRSARQRVGSSRRRPVGDGAKLTKWVSASRSPAPEGRGDGALDGDYQFKVKMSSRACGARARRAARRRRDGRVRGSAPAGATPTWRSRRQGLRVRRRDRVDRRPEVPPRRRRLGVSGTRHRIVRVPSARRGLHGSLPQRRSKPGGWAISVKLAVAKVSKTSVNIGDSALTGAFGDDNTVSDASWTPRARSSIRPTPWPVDGASVSVPPTP